MIYVLFEVTIKNEYINNYLELASNLNEHLLKQKGFLRSERFSSLVNEGKLLSLSVWENEKAVSEWRNNSAHYMSQQEGKNKMFESYNIIVASKLRSYSNIDRNEAPNNANYFNN